LRARRTYCRFLLGCLTAALALTTLNAQETSLKISYPAAPRGMQVDDYHGTKVADPYRWLEDADSAETHAWVEAENKLTFGYLATLPHRAEIRQRLTKLWDYERFSVPMERGGRYFYSRNNGLQNQSVLYWTDSLHGEPRLLLDPNTLSKDGTVALGGESISEDGKYLAYALATAGSDWQEWHVREVATGKDLPDTLQWVKFSGAAWLKDGSGFFYGRYPAPEAGAAALRDANYGQKLYFHRLGTPQSEDTLVYERPDNREMEFGATVTDDGRYLLITVNQGTESKNRLYYKDLTVKDAPVVKLLDQFDAQYQVIDNEGTLFWIQTTLNAPRGRVIAIDIAHPEPSNWKTVIPESSETMQGVSLFGDLFYVTYLKDARSQVRLYALDGTAAGELALPGLGTAEGFGGRRHDKQTFYAYTSFTTPSTIYRYDLAAQTSTIFRQPKVDFDPSRYETKQVFYTSKDGTRIPMFLTYKKGIRLDGSNPTLLYAYGGFDISLTPAFSIGNLVWLEMGGIYAQPNLRGGGEYGEQWHLDGTKLKKQNVFDDFIAAAEWLITNHYTSTPKLAIRGGSNGGLLIGAVLTQRPDLFGAALPAVGVLDMLRYQKFTIGWAWASDYGTADNPEEFHALYKYSPLHNVKAGTHYPPTLITTGDHDDRVVPGHSFKFAATLQAAQGGEAPVLIRIETRAGHGAGKPTAKLIEETADLWTFLAHALRVTPFAQN
jgi:prolyl oligopeptidase